jgi:hypothetical protein
MREALAAGRRIVGIGLVVLVPALASGCAYYSFSGASIPEHISTIAIPQVEDNSLSTLTALDESLTQLLISRFVNQTRLSLETRDDVADALLRVQITRYANAPTSVGGEEIATRNRVTITVNVDYEDQVEEATFLSRTFSGFEDYDPLDPAAEDEAARAALQKVADDIFTAATSNW